MRRIAWVVIHLSDNLFFPHFRDFTVERTRTILQGGLNVLENSTDRMKVIDCPYP